MMGGVAPVAWAFVVMALSASPAHAESVELCRFDASVLPEISGLAASAIHDDVVWATTTQAVEPCSTP